MELSMEEFNSLRIPLDDIIRATNNFSDENFIGGGGFGKVFKGELSRTEGIITVAFNRLDRKSGLGDDEFWKEIMILSRFRHENLVSFVGFCDESNEMILVHEYMTRLSLDIYVSDAKLTWLKRIQICLDAARGLDFLHNLPGTNQIILHRDLKSVNILLDINWRAKIADFSLSTLGPVNDQQSDYFIDHAAGTQGYVDPLYLKTGILTKESDIYSLGIVLFELLCGRLAYARSYGNRDKILITLVHQHYQNDTLVEIIDSILRKQMSPDSIKAFSGIAYQCLEEQRKERPLVTEVVKVLEDILKLQLEFQKALQLKQVADDLKLKKEGADSFKFHIQNDK